MLSKLLKHECKTTWSTLWPVALGLIALSTVAALFNCIGNSIPAVGNALPFGILQAVLAFASVLGMLAVVVGVFIVLVSRFYRLLGDEGYLMLSLPASADAHLGAKTICAVITTLLAVVVVCICSGLMSLGEGEFEIGFNTDDFLLGLAVFLYVMLIMVLLMAGAYLFFYLCIAIAGHWPQQRLLASIITYFVLSFVLQVVFLIVVTLIGYTIIMAGGNITHSSVLQLMNLVSSRGFVYGMLALFALLCAGADAILWVITRNLMTKHLNLP